MMTVEQQMQIMLGKGKELSFREIVSSVRQLPATGAFRINIRHGLQSQPMPPGQSARPRGLNPGPRPKDSE
jgi:hypothetical protein